MTRPRHAVSFIVPGDNRSGGVRVTMCMANELLGRGHAVRILYPAVPWFSKAGLRTRVARLLKGPRAARNSGWLADFRGRVEGFRGINTVRFAPGEIVIAVGTLTIGHLEALRGDVVKLKYNHGLLQNMSASDLRLWALPLPTITVSSTLIPELEAMSGQPVLATVPNGIDPGQYYPRADERRDAIGTIYSSHPAKAPDLLPRLLQEIHRRWPAVPQVVFGTEARPDSLAHVEYHRLPSVEEACRLYSRCRVWLVPSHTEGFPGPLVEAMACRCAVISTDTYGGREIVRPGENGLLVPRGDLAAFLREIERVLGDPRLEETIAAGGLATARALTWPAAADKMEVVLDQLAAAPRGTPGGARP